MDGVCLCGYIDSPILELTVYSSTRSRRLFSPCTVQLYEVPKITRSASVRARGSIDSSILELNDG